MSDTAIKFENISKQYRLGSIGTGTLSHDLNRWWAINILRKEDPYLTVGSVNQRENKADSDYVWALKDIDFEVKQGEVLGIIGKNGAGKSTLLKLLSRVTSPTTGRILSKGRIASLLEVGTGFHPDMTGRENIFMNGAIMGMTKAEIRRRFDEIVDFSGVERYIDTPVKRYSSGMTVRLGFAIAAHLEPEILVVDEVLAVGDAEFQKKCLGKMGEVSKNEGRTVLFVSHQMNSVAALCDRCILLEDGHIRMIGDSSNVIGKYLNSESKSGNSWINSNNVNFNPNYTPLKMAIVDKNLQERKILPNNNKIGVLLEGNIEKTDPSLVVGIAVYSNEGILLFWSIQTDQYPESLNLTLGLNKFIIWIPKHLLNEGDYTVYYKAALHFKEWILQPEKNSPSITFTIKGGLSKSNNWQNRRPGLLAPILKFQKINEHVEPEFPDY